MLIIIIKRYKLLNFLKSLKFELRCVKQLGSFDMFFSVLEVRCSALPALVDGRLNPPTCTTGRSPYGTVCSLSCRQGYKLTGPTSRQCVETGKWSPEEDSVCVGQLTSIFIVIIVTNHQSSITTIFVIIINIIIIFNRSGGLNSLLN